MTWLRPDCDLTVTWLRPGWKMARALSMSQAKDAVRHIVDTSSKTSYDMVAHLSMMWRTLLMTSEQNHKPLFHAALNHIATGSVTHHQRHNAARKHRVSDASVLLPDWGQSHHAWNDLLVALSRCLVAATRTLRKLKIPLPGSSRNPLHVGPTTMLDVVWSVSQIWRFLHLPFLSVTTWWCPSPGEKSENFYFVLTALFIVF